MPEFLIWSEEHGRWWGPGRSGYTNSIRQAGRYTAGAAWQIVRDANYGGTFNEIAIPVPSEIPQ